LGVNNFGIPKTQTGYLKKIMGIEVFIEGGTYQGDTAKEMSWLFNKVYTIEKSEHMYELAKNNIGNINNVVLLKGDTRQHLEKILLDNDNILFWLDAHWSGGLTYGEEDECPLIEELNIIFKHSKNFVILIDDARLFLAPPPKPHNLLNWPTLSEILRVLPLGWEMIEFEDVIYLLPGGIFNDFRAFLQLITTEKWLLFTKKKSLVQKFLGKIYNAT